MKLLSRDWIIARLKERSTWVGLTFFASAVGVRIEPQQFEVIYSFGTALAGIIAIVWKDKPPVREITNATPKESPITADDAVNRI